VTKREIDWEGIEREYRAGIKSLRQLGAEYGPSHVAIKKRADKEGWSRDLSAKIKAAAEAKVNKDAVTREVNAETKAAEQEIVEANAEMQAGIIRAHRADITRSRNLAMALLAEVEHQTANPELYEKLAEMVAGGETEAMLEKLSRAYHQALGTPGRIDSMKKLADTLKTLIGLERQAFGIEDKQAETPYEDMLRQFHEAA